MLGKPATLQNVARTLVQLAQRLSQTSRVVGFPVIRLELRGRIEAVILQVLRWRLIALLFLFAGAGIVARVVGRQTTFHLAHDLRLDVEILGDRIDLVVAQPRQPLLGTAQVEEQLTLRLGRGDLDDAPVAQHIFVDLGLDPVNCERDQTNALVRVETLDRLHQPDVAFLDQVGLGQSITGVASRDMHDETQVRHDQPAGRFEVVLFVKTHAQVMLFFRRQNGDAVDGLNVTVEIVTRGKVPNGLKTGAHVRCLHARRRVGAKSRYWLDPPGTRRDRLFCLSTRVPDETLSVDKSSITTPTSTGLKSAIRWADR